MKMNNKGFAISTILYGLLALIILLVMFIFQVMRRGNNNSKELGNAIQEELELCRVCRIKYNNCINNESNYCDQLQIKYNGCINSKGAINECEG